MVVAIRVSIIFPCFATPTPDVDASLLVATELSTDAETPSSVDTADEFNNEVVDVMLLHQYNTSGELVMHDVVNYGRPVE